MAAVMYRLASMDQVHVRADEGDDHNSPFVIKA